MKKRPGQTARTLILLASDRSGDFAGTQAPGTNIYMARRTIDDCLDTLYIGLPGTIGTSVGVRHLDAEGDTLIAKLALSHPLHLLAVADLRLLLIGTADIITEKDVKSKWKFQKIQKIKKRPKMETVA